MAAYHRVYDCELIDKKPKSVPCPTLVTEYWITLQSLLVLDVRVLVLGLTSLGLEKAILESKSGHFTTTHVSLLARLNTGNQTACQNKAAAATYYYFYHLNDIAVGAALVWFVVLRVPQQHSVHVSTCVLEQFVGTVEDDQRNLTVAQDAQFIRFLHQAEFPLCKRHLHMENTSTQITHWTTRLQKTR